MKLIIDMASIIQTGLRKGTDAEAVTCTDANGKEETVNSAGHGYENATGYIVEVIDRLRLAPSDAIMVFEGKDSKKRRKMIDATYKGDSGNRSPEYYEEYNKCKDMIKAAFRSVGAIAATQDHAEGDDTCKYLTLLMDEPCAVRTNDGDLSVLAGINPKGHLVEVIQGAETNKLPDFVFETRHLTLYKALVGDTSDEVKGLKGFGKGAWRDLMLKYAADGIDEISAAINSNDREKIARYGQQNKCKMLLSIADNWNQVTTCWKLVKIYEDWVNTRYFPLKVEAGIVVSAQEKDRQRLTYRHHLPQQPDERLRKYMQKAMLVTADNYDEAYRILERRVAENPDLPVAFDLETSSPEDSDDWMTGRGKPDGVDPLGSYIVGFSMTFDQGGKRTMYVSVKHAGTKNVTMVQARKMIELVHKPRKPIHNTQFELCLLYNDQAKDEDGTLWRDHWKDAGEQGFLPNIDDTLFMASYVDENAMQKNLKYLSRNVLGYDQTDFNTMRTFDLVDGKPPYEGGQLATRTLKEPLIIDGRQEYDSKGRPKMATVKVPVNLLDADGNVITKRVRNKETGLMENVPKTKMVPKTYQVAVYKMHELPADKVFDYGCDDTICTSAYYNYAKFMMMLDEHWHVYREVEIDANYQHAHNFYHGFPIAVHELRKQSAEDAKIKEENERVLHDYLIQHGWLGTTQPAYTQDITPAQIKEAYGIVMGISDDSDDEDDEDDEDNGEEKEKDAVMSMRIKLLPKIIDLIKAQEREGAGMFAWKLEQLVEGDVDGFNKYVGEYFDGKPKFSYSPKQKCKLLYDLMGCTVKVRNKVTKKMREAGIRQGNPSADNLAVDYAIIELTEEGRTAEAQVLKSLKLITMVNQRVSTFYNPYPGFIHWKDGKVHSSHRQCHANTRRASTAEPNVQQLPVHAKIKGYESAFRRVVQPHKVGAVVVSLDFNAQELRYIADDSQDPMMLACYVGDRKKDMHSITGASILHEKNTELLSPIMGALAEQYEDINERRYYAFKSLEDTHGTVYAEFRSLGKKVNFTTEYGAMAPKLAATLMVSEEDAQMFIDAREDAFPVAKEWKETFLIDKAHEDGYVRTRKGAKRHLAELLDSRDAGTRSKAERQAVNFRIQGSCAEQTKLAEGRMWRERLYTGEFDAVSYGPVHDEVLSSVVLEHLFKFLKKKHKAMVADYADMQVPIVSSISVGPNLYDQVELGESPEIDSIIENIKRQSAIYEKKANAEMVAFCDTLMSYAQAELV